MGGYVYILANMRRGRTYIGVTNDLVRRVYEHREGLVQEYTKSRNIKRLVYFEQFEESPWPFSAKPRSSAGTAAGSTS